MSSSFEKQLKKVDQLIVHGKFKEADEIIEEAIKKQNISKEEKLRFLAFKSELELYFGNFNDSIKFAEMILKENKGDDNLLIEVDALTWKAVSSFFNGRTNDCLEAFEKGLTTINSVKNLPAKAVAKRKARLLVWQSFAILLLGDFNRALEIVLEAFPISEKSGYKNIVCQNLITIGECYYKLGNLDRQTEYFEKAFAIATALENKFLIAFSTFYLTRTHNWIREFEVVEELFKKALSLAEEIGAKMLYGMKNDFGMFYHMSFQFDKALKYLHEAIEAAPLFEYMTTAIIGNTYYMKYDFKKAKEYYLKSMIYCEKINDRFILPVTLYNLIHINLELNNFSRAKQYLNRLKELNEETGFERINHIYRFSTISVLKASGNINDLVKAAELLNEFLAEERFSTFNKLSVLYSLLEIRLKELQLSPNADNLKEVQKRLFHLEVEAEDRQLRRFLADVYRLQSQLALVELEMNKAIELLEKAQSIAKEIDVELLKIEIKRDREKIDQQLKMVQKYQEQKAPISETIKLVSLENTAKSIKQETVLEERDEETGEIIEYRKLFALKI